MKLINLLIALFLSELLVGNAQVNIVVNKGPFATVQQASTGEDKVIFFDGDLTDDRACTESFAATELAKFLPTATNVKQDEIKFSDPGVLPPSGTVFIIGSSFSNSLISKYELPEGTKFDNEQSYSIRSFKDDRRIVTIIEGADRIGTLYGVYRYLEILGIKFIGLGEKGTIFPGSPVAIPSDLNINENPSYLSRGFYTWGDRKTGLEFFLWMARNKFNYWTAENQPVKLLKKLGVKLSVGGHRTQGIIFNSDDEYPYNHPLFKGDENKPDDPYEVGNEYQGEVNNDGKLSYFEAHPEWYGMKDGKRIKIIYSDNASQMGTNFCTSNKDARKEFARKVAHELIEGRWKYVDFFEFWLHDGMADRWCTCSKCKEAGSYTDKLFMITYDILNELNRVHQAGKLSRRVEVSTMAYWVTLDPPSKPLPQDFDYDNSSVTFFPIRRCYAHSFADPACAEFNQWYLKTYQNWTTGEQRYYKGSIFIGEYYNISGTRSLPVLYSRMMSVDIPWYYRSGARQFYYMHTLDSLWGTWTLNQYLMGKLLWNVKTDARKIIDDYFSSYYPTTSYTTGKFYEQLEAATANIKALKSCAGTEDGKCHWIRAGLLNGDFFKLDHLHYEEHHPLLNDGPDVVEMMNAMEMARKYLEASLINCQNSIEQQRLVEDKKRFDYGYSMYRFFYHICRTSIFHCKCDKAMATSEFAIAGKYAEELKNMVDVVQVSSADANSLNGFEATDITDVFNELKELYGK